MYLVVVASMAPAPSTGIGSRDTKEGVTKRGGGLEPTVQGMVTVPVTVCTVSTDHEGG